MMASSACYYSRGMIISILGIASLGVMQLCSCISLIPQNQTELLVYIVSPANVFVHLALTYDLAVQSLYKRLSVVFTCKYFFWFFFRACIGCVENDTDYTYLPKLMAVSFVMTVSIACDYSIWAERYTGDSFILTSRANKLVSHACVDESPENNGNSAEIVSNTFHVGYEYGYELTTIPEELPPLPSDSDDDDDDDVLEADDDDSDTSNQDQKQRPPPPPADLVDTMAECTLEDDVHSSLHKTKSETETEADVSSNNDPWRTKILVVAWNFLKCAISVFIVIYTTSIEQTYEIAKQTQYFTSYNGTTVSVLLSSTPFYIPDFLDSLLFACGMILFLSRRRRITWIDYGKWWKNGLVWRNLVCPHTVLVTSIMLFANIAYYITKTNETTSPLKSNFTQMLVNVLLELAHGYMFILHIILLVQESNKNLLRIHFTVHVEDESKIFYLILVFISITIGQLCSRLKI